jgi:ribokinase
VSGRLLVVGSINHDMVVTLESLPRPGETVLGADLVERDGGQGANAAAAAAQLGATVIPARAAVLKLARHTAILTPNRTEAAQLTGRDDPDGAASALAAARARPCP